MWFVIIIVTVGVIAYAYGVVKIVKYIVDLFSDEQ